MAEDYYYDDSYFYPDEYIDYGAYFDPMEFFDPGMFYPDEYIDYGAYAEPSILDLPLYNPEPKPLPVYGDQLYGEPYDPSSYWDFWSDMPTGIPSYLPELPDTMPWGPQPWDFSMEPERGLVEDFAGLEPERGLIPEPSEPTFGINAPAPSPRGWGMEALYPDEQGVAPPPDRPTAPAAQDNRSWVDKLGGPTGVSALLALAAKGIDLFRDTPDPPRFTPPERSGGGGIGGGGGIPRPTPYRPGGTRNMQGFARQALGSFAGDARFKALYDQVLKDAADIPKPDDATIRERAALLYAIDSQLIEERFAREANRIKEQANREGTNPTELLARNDAERQRQLASAETLAYDKALATMQAQQAALLGRLTPAIQLLQQINPMQALDALARIYSVPLPENDPTITNKTGYTS